MMTEVGALPDDALAAVFHGLPLRSLAVVRCVCKAWRDVVDARALLLLHLHLLPRTVRGIFLNYEQGHGHCHFARPCSPSTTIPRADGTLSFLPQDYYHRSVSVLDHCNGLLLCKHTWRSELCVCNPATRRWTVLPRCADGDVYASAYLAFDPAESPHFQVILVPAVPEAPSPPSPPPEEYDRLRAAAEVQRQRQRALLREKEKEAPFCLDWFFSLPEEDDDDKAIGLQWEFEQLQHDDDDIIDIDKYMEWPPSPWKLSVFSSSTGQWEDRVFVREGTRAGRVEKVRSDLLFPYKYWRYAVYHHGSLYMHCRRGSFVARLSLSKSKYQIIETPANVNEYRIPYLGKLQNGVCFGIVHKHQLKIWILNESCGHMEWALKYETTVLHYAKYLASLAYDSSDKHHDGSWTLDQNVEIEDTDGYVQSLLKESEEENSGSQDMDHGLESLSEEGYEWDSDNDDTFTINTEINTQSQKYFDFKQQLNIIGFHPYKEVVFMVRCFQIVAYHLNCTKIQYLGNADPKYCYHCSGHIFESFLYTPCMIGDLLQGDKIGGQSSSKD